MFNNGFIQSLPRRAHIAIILGLVGAFIASFVVVYANINATDIGSGDEEVSLNVNTYVDDASVTVDSNEIMIIGANASAVGDSTPGVEATDTRPAVRNAHSTDNYGYQFIVRETDDTGSNSWVASPSDQFRIRVYGYDNSGPTSTLISTLYTQQGTATSTGTTEGVTVTLDLGFVTAIYDHFDIIVDRQ